MLEDVAARLSALIINGEEDCGELECADCEYNRAMRSAVDEIERLRSALDAEGNEANLLMLQIAQLRELNDDLAARINWLITTFSSYDEDGLFAFPDGAHWAGGPPWPTTL